MSDVTQILDAIGRGDAYASEQLLPLIYQELRSLAAHHPGAGTSGTDTASHGARA